MTRGLPNSDGREDGSAVELDQRLVKKLDRVGGANPVISCVWGGKPAAVAFCPDRLLVIGAGMGKEMTAPYMSSRIVAGEGLLRRVRCHGMEADLEFGSSEEAQQFDQQLYERNSSSSLAAMVALEPVSPQRVTTLQSLPGESVVQVVGVVTELSATSGFTASMKGNAALTEGMADLRLTAARMGANAIIGLTSSAFSAGGGITSALGGDAVGVLFVGTAVVAEPIG